jgi:hypothetical protein
MTGLGLSSPGPVPSPGASSAPPKGSAVGMPVASVQAMCGLLRRRLLPGLPVVAAVCHMGAHALGAAAYAVKAVGLAEPDPPEAVEDEICWQLDRMSPEVHVALRALPDDGEEGLQVVCRRQQRVAPRPCTHQLHVLIDERVAERDLLATATNEAWHPRLQGDPPSGPARQPSGLAEREGGSPAYVHVGRPATPGASGLSGEGQERSRAAVVLHFRTLNEPAVAAHHGVVPGGCVPSTSLHRIRIRSAARTGSSYAPHARTSNTLLASLD